MLLKRKPLKIIVGSIILFIVLFIATACFIVFVSPYFNVATNKKKHNDWMKDLAGDKYITELVLPGTHDSASYICDLPYFTRTQNLSIKDQLESGVRTFDMRLAAEKDNIKFTHSSYTCRENLFKPLYFSNVCNLMYDFLNENRSETIIFLAKREHGGSVEELSKLFKETIKGKEDYWYTLNQIPTLDEVRGKIVLFTRYHDDIGIYSDWADQDQKEKVPEPYDLYDYGDYNLCVQDRYKYKKGDKWEAFTSDLPSFNKQTFVLNYLTTTEGGLTSPTSIAPSLNKKFKKYDIPKTFKGSIMLDYIDSVMIEKIIEAN